ncbi:Arp, Ankyrin repeat protein [Mycena venus]|uniref:Arp, Ankyrin repeat protein n=1 Tax=Mycena venus TaxID=2733690 RepID=A0A8H7D1I1_9AGAR|nr:Arp, Ankyrin repeat protein [Mycena venus]
MRLTPCQRTMRKSHPQIAQALQPPTAPSPPISSESLVPSEDRSANIPRHSRMTRWLKKKFLHSDDAIPTTPAPHTPATLNSPPKSPGVPATSTGKPETQESALVDNMVDNLALVADLCEKIANVVDKAPLVAPLAALVSTILKTCKEIKDTSGHRDKLFARIEQIAFDLDATVKQIEGTNDHEGLGRLIVDIEKYVGSGFNFNVSAHKFNCDQSRLFKKSSALISDFDAQGKLKMAVSYKQWESKLADLDHELDSFTGRFNVNRGVDIQVGQSKIGKKVDEVQILARAKKLQEWLQSPPDMGAKHTAMQNLRHEGTGCWLLEGTQFSRWKENPGLLWIEGKSGAGKTVLSSTIIETLLAPTIQDTALPCAVAYFYFDFRTQETQLVERMLCSIILQLSKQCLDPYGTLDQHHENRKGAPPPYENLLIILDKLLSELGQIFIILDALDECNDADLLIQLISTLRARTESRVHLLFTSQSRLHFTKAFNAVAHIVLELDTTQDDIVRFVDSKLQSSKLKHWVPHTAKITRTILQKSNGMFRLAACLLIELSRCKSVGNPDIVLADLPDALFEIYDRFFETIHRHDVPNVERVLRWLVFSAKTLTLPELEDALAFDFEEHVFDPTKREDHVGRNVCELLEGLVSVDWNTSGALLTLAHASVAEYLISTDFKKKNLYSLDKGLSHTFVAQSCVGYLLYFADHPLNKTTFAHYPLSLYAATYWSQHLLLSHDQNILTNLTICLLESGSPQYIALNNLYDIRSHSGRPAESPDWERNGSSPLYLCSKIGYTVGVRFLLAKGADINASEGNYNKDTALQVASDEGHIETVKVLLDKGAKVEKSGYRIAALSLACQEGRTDVVRLLLENGADINAQGGGHGSPLGFACANGEIDIVRLLLENGADINAQRGSYGSPLGSACAEGHVDIVRLLLENGADINAQGELYGSPLGSACANSDVDIVCLLLENGANINAQGGFYGSPLGSACARGRVDIVRLLLEKGVDLDKAGGYDRLCSMTQGWRYGPEIKDLLRKYNTRKKKCGSGDAAEDRDELIYIDPDTQY